MVVSGSTFPVFPFTAVVGQEAVKLALILNAVDPGIGGVLIRGRKGTAKSTCARALSSLLPKIKVFKDCRYQCDPDGEECLFCSACRDRIRNGMAMEEEWIQVPFVTLPVNATEDNLVGGVDFEVALASGTKLFKPGLLARAHRGILYVDEVNLLDDHLVNLITDAAATGLNIVEREGVSAVHPSEFVLVGTMNPEEGELRPQFLDRFGLSVRAEDIQEADTRVAVVTRREAFENDPVGFCSAWRNDEERERTRIEQAVRLFGEVHMPEDKMDLIIGLCRQGLAVGHRADIVISRAARVLAAYRGRTEVEERDVRIAASLALPHRMRTGRSAKASPVMSFDQVLARIEETAVLDRQRTPTVISASGLRGAPMEPSDRQSAPHGARKCDPGRRASPGGHAGIQESPGGTTCPPLSSPRDEVLYDTGDPVPLEVETILNDRVRVRRASIGRRRPRRASAKRGRYVRSTMNRGGRDLALDATLRAAAPRQIHRTRHSLAVSIYPQDIREKIRERPAGTLMVFIVDASGSMGTKLMTETKGAILYLLVEAYQKRDKVCLVAFRGSGSILLLPPTNSVEIAKKKLADLPTGGRTPLAAGLLHGYRIAVQHLERNSNLLPLLVLVTDGKANVGADARRSYAFQNTVRIYQEVYSLADTIRRDRRIRSVVIDAEEQTMHPQGMARRIAERMGATYTVPAAFHSSHIAGAVRKELIR